MVEQYGAPGKQALQQALQPVGQVSTNSVFLMVTASFPAKTLEQFIALTKSRPGYYRYASPGIAVRRDSPLRGLPVRSGRIS